MENNEKFKEWIITGYPEIKRTAQSFYVDDMQQSFEAGQESMKPVTFKASDMNLPCNEYGEVKKSDYPELADIMDENFNSKNAVQGVLGHQTPNCQVCKWAYSFTKENNNSQYFTNCDAQGCQSAVEAYNTPECQALYEVEEN